MENLLEIYWIGVKISFVIFTFIAVVISIDEREKFGIVDCAFAITCASYLWPISIPVLLFLGTAFLLEK